MGFKETYCVYVYVKNVYVLTDVYWAWNSNLLG